MSSNHRLFLKTLNAGRTGAQRPKWMFDANFHPESISPNLGPHDLVTCRESGKQGLGLLTTSVIAWTCHIKPEC